MAKKHPGARITPDDIKGVVGKNGEMRRNLRSTKADFRNDLIWLEENADAIFSALFTPEMAGSARLRLLGTLKRTVYIIGSEIAEKEQGGKTWGAILENVLYDNRYRSEQYYQRHGVPERHPPFYRKSMPSAAENPFLWCFYLIDSRNNLITRQRRSEFSKQLIYAYRHRVPAEFLTAFLHEIGENEVLIRQRNGAQEDWLLNLRKVTTREKTTIRSIGK